jgi:hypothetical protein
MSNLKSLLTISPAPKGIPYRATNYADGERNHGFTLLKGHLGRVDQIEEARQVPCFRALLLALNDPRSPFISVACEKTFRSDETGHWASGFMEFAFNFSELVADAANYFALFYNFNCEAAEFIDGHAAQFHWIIQPARFTDGPCDGFTCAVWITTAQFATADDARAEWDAAVNCFCTFVETAESFAGPEIYRTGP